MRVLSRWIVGFGLLLLACNALNALGPVRLDLGGRTVIGSWPGGLLMVAAGIACAQQRRSLRVGGLYIAIVLSIVLAGTYAWIASEQWRDHASSKQSAAVLSAMALASAGVLWLIVRLRPREGIATRGYAVPITRKPHLEAAEPDHERRSEVG